MNENRLRGLQYEDVAKNYLLDQGLTLQCKNYTSRFGEIDLIMFDRDVVCFIEVKYRNDKTFGGAISAISLPKQRKIIKTAQFFISRNSRLAQHAMRFDAILLQQSRAAQAASINWIQNAFYTE